MWSKILVVVFGILLILSAAMLIKLQCNKWELADLNTQLNEQLMAKDLELGRAHTQFGDAQEKIGELEKEIQSEISQRDSLLTRYGVLEAKYIASQKPTPGTTVIEYTEGPPVEVCNATFDSGMLYLGQTDKSLKMVDNLLGSYQDNRLIIHCLVKPELDVLQVPILISYDLTLRLKGVFAETITPSGAINHYATLYEIDENGNEIGKFQLTNYEVVVEDQRVPQFFWWMPKIDIGMYGGVRIQEPPEPGFGASIGFSFFGYGLDEGNLSWRFLRLSVDIGENLAFGLSPVLWNAGDPIPILSNLYLAPHFNVDISGKFTIGVFVGASL